MTVTTVQGANTGVGSYTVATNLAAAHTDLQHKVLIVEADPRNLLGMSFARHEGIELGWAHGYEVRQRWQDGLYKSPSGTYFLPFGSANLSPATLTPLLLEIIEATKSRFEHVILLLPAHFDASPLACAVDLPLVVITPTPNTVTLLARQIAHQVHSEKTRFVLNMCRHDVRLTRDLTLILEDMLGARLLSSYVYFDIALQEAVASLGNVIVKAPKSQASREFRLLVSVTLSHLEKPNQIRF